MWPQLFGTGWEFGVLAAGAILAAFGAVIWFAMRYPRSLGPDPVADLWRRFEQGDLTSWEAAGLLRQFERQRAEAERAGRRSAGTARLRRRTVVWRTGRARGARAYD
jgi:hypothetical protein